MVRCVALSGLLPWLLPLLTVADAAAQRVRAEHETAWGTRAYELFTPPGGGAAAPLLVVLHGCTQTAADIAAGTRFDEHAGRAGWLVLYPEQDPGAHPQRCWNWYDPAHQGNAGEAAILGALIDAVIAAHGDRPVLLVGMSAGAAMATLLVAARPERFQAVALHSAPAFGAAVDVPTALSVLRAGAADPDAGGERLRSAFAGHAPSALLIHGAADPVVAPINTDQLAAQWRAAGGDARVWRIEGVGHAWSGGAADGSYTAPDGPDATDAIVRFFLERLR